MQESQAVETFLKDKTPEAFSPVVDEHVGMLRNFVYRIVLNAHDTDDIVQEAFITAYNKADSFKGNSKFSTWLCRIACNRSLTMIRNGRKTVVTDGEDCPEMRDASTSNTPDKPMINRETQSRVMTAVSALPEHLRAAITLVAIDEKETDEAAYILGCNKATLYWRIHKARKILWKELGDLI
ncbi:MAG: RNA polymerase sigma factor [Victivallales bacterium]